MDIAVLGAGAIGIEAACHAAQRGHKVMVFERGQVAESILQWAPIKMFTPWRMNTSELGRRLLPDTSLPLDVCPTGQEYVDRYLRPLARSLDVRIQHEVLGVARSGISKLEALGLPARRDFPLVIHCRHHDQDALFEAQAVLDCTGVLGQPAPAGRHGLQVPGEEDLRRSGHLAYAHQAEVAPDTRSLLLIGDGASAASALRHALAQSRSLRVTWCTTSPRGPSFASPADDPLPERAQLHRFASEARAHPQVDHRPDASVDAFRRTGEGLVAEMGGFDPLKIDQVIVCTGYRPDLSILRELQIHWCWATEGPMKLAASLLGAQSSNADCLTVPRLEGDTLSNPEPDVFILGAKSYGRRSDFLLQNGLPQIRQALDQLSP
jgi:glycine/D-amino acid oxidase-like deaminating enzyme